MQNNILDSEMYLSELELYKASKAKRMTNFAVDYFLALLFAYFIENLFSSLGFDFLYDMLLLDRLIYAIFFACYFILTEGALKGKSLAKYITRTRAVTIHGTKMEMSAVIKRSFIRVIPFEPFSFLNSQSEGWHDAWSQTTVIDESLTPKTSI